MVVIKPNQNKKILCQKYMRVLLYVLRMEVFWKKSQVFIYIVFLLNLFTRIASLMDYWNILFWWRLERQRYEFVNKTITVLCNSISKSILLLSLHRLERSGFSISLCFMHQGIWNRCHVNSYNADFVHLSQENFRTISMKLYSVI